MGRHNAGHCNRAGPSSTSLHPLTSWRLEAARTQAQLVARAITHPDVLHCIVALWCILCVVDAGNVQLECRTSGQCNQAACVEHICAQGTAKDAL